MVSLTLSEERRLRMSENRVPRKNVGPTRDEVIREWRQLHNEELHDLYSSPNIIRVIKSRRKRFVASTKHGAGRGVYRVLVVNPEGDHLEDPAADWRIILK